MRIAHELQAEPDLPGAFKRAQGRAGPDEMTELISLWKALESPSSRQHLLNEAEALLIELSQTIRVACGGPDGRSAPLPSTREKRGGRRLAKV